MGGTKGQSNTNQATSQSQTYNPAGAGYVQGALQQGQAAAQTPFQAPVAPVAGFSQDQQGAFNTVRNAQGMAQPYINQAQSYFSPQGAQDFLNPYAANVMAGMKDIFGQQNSQNTGQLTQAAGGVGADRIAVGQSELAKQQDLAAGQTLSGLYNNSVQQAQSAGYGTAALGSQAQNAAISGAQAQLGTGGLQQQLQQAQMNAPYQWDLARLAYPFQTAQFNAGITGALAPGLGGTTSGYGTTAGNATPAQPSIYSQLLGAGTAAAGIYGGFNSGSGGKGSDPNPGSSANPLPGLSASDYGEGFARGGSSPFYDDGGSVYDLPAGFNDKPINIDAQSLVPSEKLQPIQTNQPQLNLNPPQQAAQQQSSGPSFGDIAKTALQVGMMFAQRGGRVDNPFADGGGVDNSLDVAGEEFPGGIMDVMHNLRAAKDRSEVEQGSRFYDTGTRIPGAQKARNDAYEQKLKQRRFADGGDTDVINPDEPFRMPDAAAVKAWRDETPAEPLAFAGNDATPSPYAPRARAAARSDAGLPSVITGAPQGNDASAGSADDSNPVGDFAKSPWAALTAAGLGMMAGTSPFAGVNIGQGGMQGMKTMAAQREAAQKDTTIAQSAKRLAQEAKFHEDTFNRETVGQKNAREEAARPYSELTAAQKEAARQADRPYDELTAAQAEAAERAKTRDALAERQFNRPYEELTKQEQAQLEESRRQHDLARIPEGMRVTPEGGQEPIPGGLHDPETIRKESEAKRPPAMADEDLRPMIDTYKAGNTVGVLASISRGTQGPQNIQHFWHLLADDLQKEGKTGADLAAAKANFMAQAAGARTAAVRESQIETAVNEAKGTFPEVLRTSAALPRTNFTPVNAALEFYRTKTGLPEQRAYGAAIQAAVTAYSQAMSRTGANSVYAQQHAAEILSKTDGPEALKAAIDQLNIEMGIAQRAPEETRQAILNRILGIKTNQPAQPATGAAPATGSSESPAVGERRQFKQGWGVWDGNQWKPE